MQRRSPETLVAAAALLASACQQPHFGPHPPPHCETVDYDDVLDVTIGDRTFGDILAWADEAWTGRQVTWTDGSTSTADVHFDITDDTFLIVDGCHGGSVWSNEVAAELVIDGSTSIAGLAELWADDDSLVLAVREPQEVRLGGRMASVASVAADRRWAFSLEGNEAIVVGGAFVCDEREHGDCLAE